jgi:hypothetical protein
MLRSTAEHESRGSHSRELATIEVDLSAPTVHVYSSRDCNPFRIVVSIKVRAFSVVGRHQRSGKSS